MKQVELSVRDAEHMEALGACMGSALHNGQVLVFRGPLGAGKTTLIRGILRGLGYRERVTSPTYILVETYVVGEVSVYHFDLYRLHDTEELENIGVRDYMDGSGVCLVEWPEHAGTIFAHPDLETVIDRHNGQRRVQVCGYTDSGISIMDRLP